MTELRTKILNQSLDMAYMKYDYYEIAGKNWNKRSYSYVSRDTQKTSTYIDSNQNQKFSEIQQQNNFYKNTHFKRNTFFDPEKALAPTCHPIEWSNKLEEILKKN